MEGFDYVINPPEVPKIAFGSSLERETMPQQGPNVSSFMRRCQGELRSYPGPLEYNTEQPLGFKYPSKLGFSAFASKQLRLPFTKDSEFPPIGAYNAAVWPASDKSGYTIGKATGRFNTPKWLTPGSSTYPVHTAYPKLKMTNAFGSKGVIWPAVAVFCSPYNISRCYKCDRCPFGDYFHNFSTNQDMCRPCMRAQLQVMHNCALQVVERYRMRRDIQQFVPARYCGFFHRHDGTNAAVELTSRKELRHKIRTENYLYCYHSKS